MQVCWTGLRNGMWNSFPSYYEYIHPTSIIAMDAPNIVFLSRSGQEETIGDILFRSM